MISKVEKTVKESFFQFCSQKAKNQTSLQKATHKRELNLQLTMFGFVSLWFVFSYPSTGMKGFS